MAANGGGDFHHVEDAGFDLQEAQEVAQRAMLSTNRVVSEDLEMPLTAIPESEDDDAIPHVPQQRMSSDPSDSATKQSDFSFTPFGAASGRRSPTLMQSGVAGGGAGAETPFEPQHDQPDSPSLLPRSALSGVPPRPASPGPPSSSGLPALPQTGSWGAGEATASGTASLAPPRSGSGLTRSGSSSCLDPEPYEAPYLDPVASLEGEDERLPALPAAAFMPVTGTLHRPASAEAIEFMSATSGSLPNLETAPSQQDTLAAAGGAAADAPPTAEPAPAATAPPAGAADGAAAVASADTPKPVAKARRLVPKTPAAPATPPEDAFVGLPDDVLHGMGDQRSPAADASSTIVEPAMSVQEEPAPHMEGAGVEGAEPAAEAPGQASAADAAGSAEAAEPAAVKAASPAAAAAVPQSPHAPAAADAEAVSFAPQTPEVSRTEVHAPTDERHAADAAEPPAAGPVAADAEERLQHGSAQAPGAQPAEQAPLEYVSRDTQTPHMERKLRNLQAKDWEGAGDLGADARMVRTRSQKEHEEDLQSWKHMDGQHISASAAKAVEAVDVAAPLGEDFKVHRSQLEQDVEAAKQRERTPQPPSHRHLPSYMRPTANSANRKNQTASSPRAQSPVVGRRDGAPPPAPQGSLEAVMVRHQSALEAAKANSASSAYEPIKRAPPPSVPGLDELLADTGRIQRAREEAAQRHSELYNPVPRREAAAGPGLDQVLIVTKSQLELEKEAAARVAGTAAEGSPQLPPGSPADKARRAREAAAAEHIRRFRPAAPKSQESDSFGGAGLGEVMLKHKSTLQRKKEEAEAAGANSPTAPLRSGSRSQMLAQRQGEQWGGRSLADLQKPHKSRLLREQEEWAERSGTKLVSSRKPIAHKRHVKSPGEKPDAPSFMKDTMASTMKHIDMPEPPRTPGT